MTYSLFGVLGSGAIVGLVLGLIGAGGSIIATPLLLYVVGVSSPHVAIGTGALAVSVNALASFLTYAVKGHVWWRCALVFTPLGVLGAWIGSSTAQYMDGQFLLILFGAIMLVAGLRMVWASKSVVVTPRKVNLKTCVITGAMGVAAGMASGFFGIGGGFLIVPALLMATRMPMVDAIGTSLLSVGAFGLTTAITYAMADNLDWVLAGYFIAGGIIGGAVGFSLSSILGDKGGVLRQMFGGLVIVMALYVVYSSSID